LLNKQLDKILKIKKDNNNHQIKNKILIAIISSLILNSETLWLNLRIKIFIFLLVNKMLIILMLIQIKK